MKHTHQTSSFERPDAFDWELLADADAEYAEWQRAHREEDLAALCSPGFVAETLTQRELTRAA